jgi:MoxR-like ATPase
LLEAMQERTVTVDGVSHPLTAVFTVFATQNPIEFEGTYPLPEAELDRFMAKVLVDYPDATHEQGILTRYVAGFEADRPATYGVRPVIEAAGLERLRHSVEAVRVEPQITAYITSIVRATRAAASLTPCASAPPWRRAESWASGSRGRSTRCCLPTWRCSSPSGSTRGAPSRWRTAVWR